MISTDQELKVSRMTKRSQNKKLFGRDNYKLREFVLQPYCIRYFEVSGGNRGKEKGQLLLSHVKFIEKVQDDELDNKKNAFQVAYAEDAISSTWYLLYIVANSAIERDDWISLVRFSLVNILDTRERGASFLPRYHPGVWKRPGRYSCCDDISRRSMGCQPTNEPGPSVVIEQLWRTATGVDSNNCQPQIPQAATTANIVTNTQPYPVSTPQLVTMQLNSNVQLTSNPLSVSDLNSTNITSTSASFIPLTSAVGLPVLHQTPGLSTPVTGVLMSTAVTSQFSHLNNALRRSGMNQNRGHSLRYIQPTFDMDEGENTVIAVYNYNPVRENQLPLQKGEKYYVVNQSNAQWWYVKNMTGQLGYVPTNYVHKPNSLNSFDWYYKDITRQQAEAILLDENREGCFLVRDSVSKKNTYTLSVTSKDPEAPGKLKVHHYHIHRTESSSLNGHLNGCGVGSGSGSNSGLNSTASVAATSITVTTTTNTIVNMNGSTGTGSNTPKVGSTINGEAQYYLSEKHAFPTISDVIHYHKHNSGGLVVRLRSPPTKDRESPVTAGMGLDEFELDPAELHLEREPIGKGQFGVVKRGKFRNIPVAVKQMVEGAMNEDDFIEEAKNMRFLNHPNLVQLFGVVLKKRPIMIITEYMKHGSLRDFMRQRQTQFCNRPVVMSDICAQVANGMAYLEQEQFVHRDLAARNCLVKSINQNSVHVKVADFGMARFLLDNVYEPSAGTKFPVRWAPPEVFQSTYTAKADVWSFGVLMWEVFTCCSENPYQGMNNTQVYQYIVGGGRLHKPAVCPDRIYVLMLECWQHVSFKVLLLFHLSNQDRCLFLESEGPGTKIIEFELIFIYRIG
ncbi:tyrosine kinase [Schistosoma mansoni]|uniref:tyrosine kinase n=1 Tax=Schistosoma mansoni TaxID=6183 RepID=UPI00022DC08E|nr:tyrosine kinase [Schistosoma mansoni]|eukprot:XP_018648547.1 tyrosine kinase [Schistosoma mansoni]